MATLSGQGVFRSWRPTQTSAGALISLSRGRRSTWRMLACQGARRGGGRCRSPGSIGTAGARAGSTKEASVYSRWSRLSRARSARPTASGAARTAKRQRRGAVRGQHQGMPWARRVVRQPPSTAPTRTRLRTVAGAARARASWHRVAWLWPTTSTGGATPATPRASWVQASISSRPSRGGRGEAKAPGGSKVMTRRPSPTNSSASGPWASGARTMPWGLGMTSSGGPAPRSYTASPSCTQAGAPAHRGREPPLGPRTDPSVIACSSGRSPCAQTSGTGSSLGGAFGATLDAQQHLALHGEVHRLQGVLVGQQAERGGLEVAAHAHDQPARSIAEVAQDKVQVGQGRPWAKASWRSPWGPRTSAWGGWTSRTWYHSGIAESRGASHTWSPT